MINNQIADKLFEISKFYKMSEEERDVMQFAALELRTLEALKQQPCEITYNDLIEKFEDAFPFAEIDDYRPVCHELFEKDKVGITIWLKNGDMIVYYPKQGESEGKESEI